MKYKDGRHLIHQANQANKVESEKHFDGDTLYHSVFLELESVFW